MANFGLYFVILLNALCVPIMCDIYKAAVVDFRPHRISAAYAADVILDNIGKYSPFMEAAKNLGANIIVFPEFGLTTYEVASVGKTHLDNYAVTISSHSENEKKFCSDNDEIVQKALKELSCRAKENQIYLVANVVEKEPLIGVIDDDYDNLGNDDDYYSTGLVFDPEGKLIERYRKMNVIKSDPPLSNGDKIITFKIQSSKFGVLINHDLISGNVARELIKQNVTNLVYMSAWVSEAPFLTALSIQSGFSKMYGINLLASNVKNGLNLPGGSGIYTQNGGAKMSYAPSGGSTLLVMEITSDNFEEKPFVGDNPQFLKDNLKEYETTPILVDGQDHSEKICKTGGCCEITYNANGESRYTYMIVLNSGKREFDSLFDEYAICGIIACKNGSKDSCGLYYSYDAVDNIIFRNISIKIEIIPNEEEISFPSTLTYSFLPMKSTNYMVTRNNGLLEMKLEKTVNNLLTFAFVTKGTVMKMNAPGGNFDEGVQGMQDSSATYLSAFPTATVFIATVSVLMYLINK